jgi:hypothetical protein
MANAASIASGATVAFGPFTDLESVTTSFGPAGFAQAGGGLFSITGTSLSGLLLQGGGGNIQSTQATTAGINAFITYDYTERTPPVNVPEPAMLGLMGLGFAAMGAARRRRQA